MSTTAETVIRTTPLEEQAEFTSDLAVRRRFGVASLLQTRPELRGAYAFADVVEESTRWCA